MVLAIYRSVGTLTASSRHLGVSGVLSIAVQ